MANDPAKQRGLVEIEHPLDELPVEERLKVIREIGANATESYKALTDGLDDKLKNFEPIHAVCSAGYLLAFTGDKPVWADGYSWGQHQAELLQALLLRKPLDFYEAAVGTPDQVQKALDLTKNISDARLRMPYADIPDDQMEYAKRSAIEEMRVYTQVMRGEYYPEQLVRLYRPLLVSISARFAAVHGIAPETMFDLMRRLSHKIEDRLNEHVKKVAAFFKAPTLKKMVEAYKNSFPGVQADVDSIREMFEGLPQDEILRRAKFAMIAHSDLRLPDIFGLTPEDIETELKAIDPAASVDAAKAVLDKMSMTFGETADKPIDHIILDNPVWGKPLIKIKENWLLPLPTTFNSYCPTIFLRLAETNEALKQVYETAKADGLEQTTEALLKKAFPSSTIWQSVKWRDPVGNKEFENDVVALIDGWLMIAEVKSGQVTDSARRGSYDRLKREIGKLMVDPSDQSKRFADYLMANPKAHQFACEGGQCTIDSSKLNGVIRLNVTNESIGNLNSRGSKLVDAGLIPKGTDLAPTMSLSSLDIVLQFLGSQSAVAHYLVRRKEFESSANYMADELDLVSFYLENGFSIGERESDGSFLMIYGHSADFDVKLTRSEEHPLGRQESKALTPYWNGFIEQNDKEARHGWLGRAMRLRNVPTENQQAIEKAIRHATYKMRKKGPQFEHASYGPKSRLDGLIALARGDQFDQNELETNAKSSYNALAAEGIKQPLFILVAAPHAATLYRLTIVVSDVEAAAEAVKK